MVNRQLVAAGNLTITAVMVVVVVLVCAVVLIRIPTYVIVCVLFKVECVLVCVLSNKRV